jgi:ribosomal protein S18 acetylase RimI-like enzyme
MTIYRNHHTFEDNTDDSLSHHGIKGQKWGIRRFQNSDGTLTEAGKRRYARVTLGKRISITEDVAKREPHKFRHVRIDATTKGYAYKDRNGKVSAMVNVEHKKNGEKWIQGLEIFDQYKGHGYSKKLLDVAVKDLDAKYLSVNKKNKIAKHIYDKYGFKTIDETDVMYMMKYDR